MKNTETKFDFDNTVSTEDRFALRRFLEEFIDCVNNQNKDDVARFFSVSIVAEGFSDFILQSQQVVEMFYKKFFGRKHNYIRLPKIKLTSSKQVFFFDGEYEEYQDAILSAFGSIQIQLIKNDSRTGFEITKIKFFPRMRSSE